MDGSTPGGYTLQVIGRAYVAVRGLPRLMQPLLKYDLYASWFVMCKDLERIMGLSDPVSIA